MKAWDFEKDTGSSLKILLEACNVDEMWLQLKIVSLLRRRRKG